MTFSTSMYFLIAALSILNFVRILLMLIGSDFYDIRHMRRVYRARGHRYRPRITVVIPAYNEETGVIRTVRSVLASTYKNRQVIVVNDGSKDRTLGALRNFQRKNPGTITIVNQTNAGKAAAINRAVKYWTTGKLVMVVDADSLVHPHALEKMTAHFRNRRLLAVAANVKIIPTHKALGLAQRFEYLISYRMKRSLSVFSMEYIVGGVGSTFRRSTLLKSGLYDTDTMTEDIDLTVKFIQKFGNTRGQVQYAADALMYTEHVLTFRSLVKQRFRWKYGRLQTFVKNRSLFFSRHKKHGKMLTWYQLPYALISEATLFIEPLLVGYILFVVVWYGDLTSLLSVYVIVTGYVFLMLLGEETESLRTKVSLALLLPVVYLFMYVLTAVEFLALIKSLTRTKRLLQRTEEKSSWDHVERSGKAVDLIK